MIKKISIICIALLICYFFYDNYSENKKELEKRFAIENTDEIEKIFLSDRKGTNLILNKTNDSWIINDTFLVRNDAITTLLTTIKEIEVQRPVSNSSFNNVIKQLATTGVKVEIYYNNNVKTYTVGGSTSDHLGTYMLMDNSDNPYIMHIPGFNGFLSPRYGIQGYELDITKWRDNSIFNIQSENIEEVTLINIQDSYKSFKIKNKPLILENYEGNKIKYNLNFIVEYFNLFSDLECEKYKGFNIDISNEKYLYKLSIKHNGKTDTLDVYSFSKRNNNKNQSEPNVERFYARLNGGEYMLIQKYVFNKVFISIDDFTEKL